MWGSNCIHSLKLMLSTWQWMIGILFSCWAGHGWPIFRCDLFDLGSVTILSQVKLARKNQAANAPASKVLAVDSGETHLPWIFRSLQARWAQKTSTKTNSHLYRWINPRVKPIWIRPFCWGFHITSLFIPIDRVEPMVWMDSGGSPFRVARGLDGTQSFRMDCETQQKKTMKKSWFRNQEAT